jgi:hypothetical protein
MKDVNCIFYLSRHLVILVWLAVNLTIGCSKKQPPTPPPDNAPTNAAAADAPAPAPISTTAPPQTPVDPSEVGDKLAEAKTALTTHDYEKAATALAIPQKTIFALNADQLAAYNQAKGSLARSVIAAANAGDPSAKAILQKMYQEH